MPAAPAEIGSGLALRQLDPVAHPFDRPRARVATDAGAALADVQARAPYLAPSAVALGAAGCRDE
jgi:hypothetical protein